jgi:hypothetical protein
VANGFTENQKMNDVEPIGKCLNCGILLYDHRNDSSLFCRDCQFTVALDQLCDYKSPGYYYDLFQFPLIGVEVQFNHKTKQYPSTYHVFCGIEVEFEDRDDVIPWLTALLRTR